MKNQGLVKQGWLVLLAVIVFLLMLVMCDMWGPEAQGALPAATEPPGSLPTATPIVAHLSYLPVALKGWPPTPTPVPPTATITPTSPPTATPPPPPTATPDTRWAEMYIQNLSPAITCVKFEGSGIGWDCYVPGTEWRGYGSFPAGTYKCLIDGWCGRAYAVGYVRPGVNRWAFWCDDGWWYRPGSYIAQEMDK